MSGAVNWGVGGGGEHKHKHGEQQPTSHSHKLHFVDFKKREHDCHDYCLGETVLYDLLPRPMSLFRDLDVTVNVSLEFFPHSNSFKLVGSISVEARKETWED